MIVVDASVLVSALLDPSPLGAAAARRLEGEEVLAPELLDVEVIHALRGLVRSAKVSEAAAARALDRMDQAAIERVPHRALATRIWALRHNLTAYDASYVALAEQLDASLVTADAGIARAPGIRCAVELIS